MLSTFLNAVLVIVLVGQIRKPVFSELTDESITPTQFSNFANPGQVIGEQTGDVDNLVKVTKVIDGDTIVLDTSQTLRYIGIDAPEVSKGKNCFAEEATNKNKELVLGKEVRLEKDVSETDRYGRLLRYVYVGNTFINETLVFEGYATAITYQPDVKYSELFGKAERQAREYKRGLWGRCGEEDVLEDNSSVPTTDNQQLTTTNSNCNSNLYNCTDFKTRAEAQAVYDSCGGASNDVHRLDSDADGIACESLP